MEDKQKKILIGRLIKTERERQKITQDKLSDLVGIDATNLSKIERGISFPSFKNFCKIIEILKIEPNYFLSFIKYEKKEINSLDKELTEIFKTFSNDTKKKIIELITTL